MNIHRYAKDQYGNVRHVSIVENGFACQCQCLQCHEPMVANHCESRQSYFSHYAYTENSRRCTLSRETIAHALAVQVIKDLRKIFVPEWLTKDAYQGPALLDLIGEVKENILIDEMRPDIYCQFSEYEWLLIEIYVTHPVDATKQKKINEFGVDCVEITIPAEVGELDDAYDVVKNLILSGSNTRWLFNRARRNAELEEAKRANAMMLRRLTGGDAAELLRREIASLNIEVDRLRLVSREIVDLRVRNESLRRKILDGRKPRYEFKPEIILTQEQENAISVMEAVGPRQMALVTGGAGSGKSVLVREFKSRHPDAALVAPTGTAAQLIGGVTIHRFIGKSPRHFNKDDHFANERMRKASHLLIDEASMLGATMLGFILNRMKCAEAWPPIIFIGDLMQLQPVQDDWIFDSEAFNNVRIVRLNQNMRAARDHLFAKYLNRLRCGLLDDACVQDMLAGRTVRELPRDCVNLVSTNNIARERNLKFLAALPGTASKFLASKEWHTRTRKGDGRSRFEDELILKPKAKVILITNNYAEGNQWRNGSLGKIEQITDHTITVRLVDGERLVNVGRTIEDICDADGRPECTVTQFPILLGYAITTHRCQGMTLDRVGILLDERSSMYRQHGMVYVAISRCKSAGGLYVCGKLNCDIAYNETAYDISFGTFDVFKRPQEEVGSEKVASTM